MDAVVPRLAATVMLVRDRGGLEVLMVERHDQVHFASALVFPGGGVDADDRAPDWLTHVEGAGGLEETERAVRIAALRELFEETGLFVGAGQTPAAGPFREAIAAAGARLDLATLVPFAHWITPVGAPKRFDTHFRLCAAEGRGVAVSDGRETVSAEWISPGEALRLGAAGERKVIFPTRLNLELLAKAGSVDEAMAQARARTIVTVTPWIEHRESGVHIVIPPDAGYGDVAEFAGPSAFR